MSSASDSRWLAREPSLACLRVLDALRTAPTWTPDDHGGFEAIVGPLRFVAFPCDEAGKPDWSWWIDPSAFDLADTRLRNTLRNNTTDVLVEGYSRNADAAKREALNHAPEALKKLVELILIPTTETP